VDVGSGAVDEADVDETESADLCPCNEHPDPEGICTNARFSCWVSHLYKACVGSEGPPSKEVKEVHIQRHYFQNRFIFARRRFAAPV
jgi:hypothetical protein